jgi:hypothetical protein
MVRSRVGGSLMMHLCREKAKAGEPQRRREDREDTKGKKERRENILHPKSKKSLSLIPL